MFHYLLFIKYILILNKFLRLTIFREIHKNSRTKDNEKPTSLVVNLQKISRRRCSRGFPLESWRVKLRKLARTKLRS